MIELPEAATNARQVRETLKGKKITGVHSQCHAPQIRVVRWRPSGLSEEIDGKNHCRG
jgi:formamidopyrimidine-DNA glycosylase